MYNAMQGIGTIAGALIGGFIAQYFGYMVVFLISSAFLVVGLAMIARINLENELVKTESAVAAHG